MDDDVCLYPSTLSTGFHQFLPAFGCHGFGRLSRDGYVYLFLPVSTPFHLFLAVTDLAGSAVTDKCTCFYRLSTVFTCFWPSRIVASSAVTDVLPASPVRHGSHDKPIWISPLLPVSPVLYMFLCIVLAHTSFYHS